MKKWLAVWVAKQLGLPQKATVQQAIELIKSKDLTIQERNLCTGIILDRLEALPLASIITIDESGTTLIHGQALDIDKARMLYEAASAALDNKAEKLIDQQVLWAAITGGLHNGDSPEKLLFYRAAIWFGQQREAQLKILAQRDQEPAL